MNSIKTYALTGALVGISAIVLAAPGSILRRDIADFLKNQTVEIDTADVNGGNIDGVTIGASVESTATLASLTTTGLDKEILTASTVSLTSPAKTIDASDKRLIVVNTDENQTGAALNGGTQWQVVTVITGSGSKTLRFDDGTSVVAGGNLTITEGQSDIIDFICISTDGNSWAVRSLHDN